MYTFTTYDRTSHHFSSDGRRQVILPEPMEIDQPLNTPTGVPPPQPPTDQQVSEGM